MEWIMVVIGVALYLVIGAIVLASIDSTWWGAVESVVGSESSSICIFAWISWPLVAVVSIVRYCLPRSRRQQAVRRRAGDVKNLSTISLQGRRRRHVGH